MNTYKKYCPNVFVAKCDEKHEKGDVIEMTTKYGDGHNAIIFNHLLSKEDSHFYSVVREDGFNYTAWCERKAEKYNNYSLNAKSKSNEYWDKSNKDSSFLRLGEPIKVGHHSEKRHRKIIGQARNNTSKSFEYSDKAESYSDKASYWKNKANKINLSMPESIDYYTYKYNEAEEYHYKMKTGEIERSHGYSLTYAKKKTNDMKKKYEIALKLWG